MQITPLGPRPSYTARDYNSILADLQAYIAATRPDLLPDFQNQQGLGPFLTSLIAYVGDIASFAVDAAALAIYLDTTIQLNAALRFARSVGYVPHSAIAATLTVVATSVPATLTASGGIIAAGQSIPGPNNTTFYVPSPITIPVNATTITTVLSEGVQYTETVDSTNVQYFSYTTLNGIVAEGSWSVYVGDPTNMANLWTQVDSVSLETSATNTYQISFSDSWQLIVTFGNGTNGAIPGQTITVNYVTCQGSDGNIPLLGLSGSLQAVPTGGTAVPVNFSNSTVGGVNGSDAETLNSLRVNVPAFIRSGDTCITLQDYNDFPMQVQGVTLVYASPTFAGYSANLIDVALWSSTSTTFTGEGFSPPNASAVTYEAYSVASNTIVNNVRSFLQGKTSVCVFPNVLANPIAFVDIYSNSIIYDSRYAASTVHAGITAAVVSLFESSSGFKITLASLVTAMGGVAGVISCAIDRIVFAYQGYARAIGSIAFGTGTGSQPAAHDSVSVSDSPYNTIVFEFTPDGTHDVLNTPVAIGTSASDTCANLVIAINASGLAVSCFKTGATLPTISLTELNGGTNYNLPIAKTGSVMVVSGMSGGSSTLGPIVEDHRAQSYVGTGIADPWPPGTYSPGSPYTSGTWQDGGVLPYSNLIDVEIPLDFLAQRYFTTSYQFNNTIVFDPASDLWTLPQALVLRRLVANLTVA